MLCAGVLLEKSWPGSDLDIERPHFYIERVFMRQKGDVSRCPFLSVRLVMEFIEINYLRTTVRCQRHDRAVPRAVDRSYVTGSIHG